MYSLSPNIETNNINCSYLKPGGWVELVEHEATVSSDDGTYHNGTALYKWFVEYRDGLNKLGHDWELPLKLKSMVESHGGFTEIKEVTLKLPWGGWCKDKKLKEIGRRVRLDILTRTLEC